jgi:hypothetical protein
MNEEVVPLDRLLMQQPLHHAVERRRRWNPKTRVAHHEFTSKSHAPRQEYRQASVVCPMYKVLIAEQVGFRRLGIRKEYEAQQCKPDNVGKVQHMGNIEIPSTIGVEVNRPVYRLSALHRPAPERWYRYSSLTSRLDQSIAG